MSRVVIIGAGFAGASTAWHLVKWGAVGNPFEVVILERDAFPGNHSSGRNAGMVRQSTCREIAPLAVSSTRWLRDTAGAATAFRFDATGSILLGEETRLAEIRRVLLDAGVEAAAISACAAGDTEAADLLAAGVGKAALVTRTDGVLDPHSLLSFFLREATSGGVELRCGAAVDEIVVEDHRVRGVVTGGELLEGVVVNAAGGWAGELAPPGAADARIEPTSRSVFHTGPVASPPCATRAYVWDIEDQWYFRAESGGWLLCAGEERDHPPGVPEPELARVPALREKLARYAPPLADVPIASAWAGLRTFSSDRLPVIGRDPNVAGLFWMAGLGGHGVTICHAAGALGARAVLGADIVAGDHSPFDPSRFSAR